MRPTTYTARLLALPLAALALTAAPAPAQLILPGLPKAPAAPKKGAPGLDGGPLDGGALLEGLGKTLGVEALEPLKVRLSEGDSLKLVPGAVSKAWGFHVKGFRTGTADKVEVVFPQRRDLKGNLDGGIVVFPGDTRVAPDGMARPEHRFEFLFRALETAEPDEWPWPVVIRVSQKGRTARTILLWVTIVPPAKAAR